MKRRSYDIDARGHLIKLGTATKIMGIVNCTPDSFSQDGILKAQRADLPSLLRYARRLIREGADIIDVGGESTRPNAKPVPVAEELRRVIPLIKALGNDRQVIISVDTSKPEVARCALDAGASIVNNVMGANPKPALLKAVRDHDAAIVLMHSRGTPRTMHRLARYKDLMGEIAQELELSIEKCLKIGIKKERIILDPGIGFAKTGEDNLKLIDRLSLLGKKGFPILLGPSRKSFIGKVLNNEAHERMMGTAAAVSAGIMNGAHIVRVHDVKQMKEVALITDAILNSK